MTKLQNHELILVCYNIGLGGEYLKTITKNFSTHKDLSRADIVCLQEASSSANRLDAHQIAKTLGKDYEFTNAETQKIFGVMQANAIIYNRKKLDLISSEVMQLPSLPSYVYLLYSPFTGKVRFDQRNCLLQTFLYGKKTIRIYNVHLDIRGGYKLKEDQMWAVLKRVDSYDQADLDVICGDLNTANLVPERISNKERFLRKLNSHLGQRSFHDVSSQIKWTFKVTDTDINPRQRFFPLFHLARKLGIKLEFKRKTDFIFARTKNRHFKIEAPAYVLDLNGSDHLPLVLKIKAK